MADFRSSFSSSSSRASVNTDRLTIAPHSYCGRKECCCKGDHGKSKRGGKGCCKKKRRH